LRSSPWLSGALLLALAGGLVAPAVYQFGVRRWPLYLGLLAGLVLLFGRIESAWRSRPLPGRHRVDRSRFRVVTGGRAEGKGKGNGHAQDLPGHPDDDGDKPRWVM
jgi:hypothetical protein